MKKLLYVIVFVLLMITMNFNASASSKIDLCVVYESNSYEKGDVVTISIELPKFSNLFEVIIRMEYDSNYLSPVIINNEYFKLNNHSIFDAFVVNKKINDNTLYAELMKSSVEDGYYSSYKNNLCSLEFNVLSHIDNIEDYFNSSNIQVFLFDVNHSLIEYEIKLVKQIDAGFKNSNYDIEVFSENIDLSDIFYVNNRNANEYLILEEKIIDYALIGSQILQIGVFDYLTGKYLSFSTIINIIDNKAPVISGESIYEIKDTELQNINFLDYIKVSDNYDQNVSILVNYYNKEMKIINDNYKDVLKKNLVMYVGYVCIDSSNNKSEEFIVQFKLKDTTAPCVSANDVLIIDNELEKYDIINSIKISDELDEKPSLILSFYNNNEEIVDDYKKYLSINECCYMEVYGVDKFNNISDKIRVKICLIDKTKPIIECEEEEYIKDIELNNFNFCSLINVVDNDRRECNVSYDCYIGDKIVNVEDFKSNLLLGRDCFIKYYVYDYSLNFATTTVKVILKDTLSPVISVNIENDGVYKHLDKIEYEVVDNLSSNVIVNVYLDNELYNGEKVLEGRHELTIEAIDEAGNKIEENYYFVVSDMSFLGNLLNGNIKLKCSVIIVIVIISSLIIGVLKFRFGSRLKKNYKES